MSLIHHDTLPKTKKVKQLILLRIENLIDGHSPEGGINIAKYLIDIKTRHD